MVTTIMCLPDEVMDIILSYNDISIEDIVNFRLVCKHFRFAANYDAFTKKKFSQRWSSAKKFYDKQSDEHVDSQKNENSLNFMDIGKNCVIELRSYVSRIICKHYYNNSNCTYDSKTINNLILFEDIFHLDTYLNVHLDNIIEKPENIMKYYVFTDEMKNLLQSPRRTDCNLTERYCNIKLFHYMRERAVENKLKRFIRRPDNEQLLERAATIVAQSIQPEKDIFYSNITASLDTIALEVLTCLRRKHPDHSIFSTSVENFCYWKNNNINDNYWNDGESTEIADALNEYIFGKLNFQPSNSEDPNMKYMCIDYVVENKCGHQIILLIIYHSVARRLGLCYQLISLQYRYLTIPTYCVFWKSKHAQVRSEGTKCFNINSKKFPECFENHMLLYWRLYYNGGNIFNITAAEIWKEVKEIIVDLINQNNLYNIQLSRESRLFGLISRKVRLCFKKTIRLTRSEDVKFAVGMIVTHNNQSTDSCAGVIIGWHRPVDTHITFSMSGPYVLHSSHICKQCVVPLNHCNNLNFAKQQTNYVILTENNKICYVGEDSLTLTPKWIDNSEVGRYFCKFENTHYVPNKTLTELYPQDAIVTAQLTMTTPMDID